MTNKQILAVDIDETKPTSAATASTSTTALDLVEEAGPSVVVDEDADLAGGLPPRAVTNADGSITLPLRHPVTLQIKSSSGGVRSETYDKLTFNRFVGADLRAIQSTAKDSQGTVILARSARIREAVMAVLYDRMDGADIMDAIKIAEVFLGGGRTKPE
ncbi:hypothetical protein Xaut_4488 [Xanthobacter versatilis]|uniref:Uncharacterized protein n=1 Tax=Xanthobacter autotrophicus (strain ATCC BAA-1158 / Py2) TaxID=78245 RepID=A7INW3_XANP2|nr:hypothetical protein Xaut_4488 [Xanthobacter autotrophicus Py2]